MASAAVAVGLAAPRALWAAVFGKPALAAVLVPSAVLLLAGRARDAAAATLEGSRRLRALFWLDLACYGAALGGLALWRTIAAPRTAAAVQWVQAAAAAAGSVMALATARRLLEARPSRREAARLAAFGRYSFGTGLGATIGQQADVLVAGGLMDAGGVASYQAAKLSFRVFNVVAQAINQVLMPIVSRLHAEGRTHDLRVLYEKSVCFLYLALLPVLVGLVVFAPQIYDLFFGGRYAASVPVFRILVTSALTLPFASVGSPFLVGLGRLRSLFWITWLGTGLGIGLAWVWIPRHGAAGAAFAVLAGALVGMVARTWVLQRLLQFALLGVAGRTRDALAFVRRRLGVLERSGDAR
jgi:O-antigen/teichoic acid export membrane protein